jgi:2-oxoglutarate/2-oxoacid ferredoxin oxidoreductase subunit alpha
MPIQGVNDFVIRFANVNGSGSASANLLFARSILRMGVVIAPRNIFPSNIQGLPTWYEVRVTPEGWLGARGGTDLMVAMNPQTFAQDVASIEPGGYLFYDSSRPIAVSKMRDDIIILGMPLTDICTREYSDPRQRQLFKNIVYVGALAALLDIAIGEVEKLISEQFKGKDRLIAPNLRALRIGYDDAKSRFACPLGIRVARSEAVGERILVDGNFAAGLGAVYGGATVCAWYPITPSTSLAEAFEKNCARLRVDRATGEKRYAIVQAEDEIAAIGMVVGAGWNGARAFTATSGPGISLMQEFLGLAYFAEVPSVVFDVQRGGPSTGMPTRTQQSDILSCALASHGDTKHVLLLPEDPGEAFDFSALAFDLADQLQTPIFVMLDLDIGMNSHLCAPFAWDDARKLERGKVMSSADLEQGREFGRYLDVDGDGVPWRTIPGTHPTRGAFFTRGTSRDRYARYTEEGSPYVDNMERLLRKFDTARKMLPRAALRKAAQPTRIGVIHYGSTAPAMEEAALLLAREGVHIDALRIRAFPFGPEVGEFISAHEQVFVVEQNRDAQMRSLLMMDLGVDPAQLVAILHFDGTPITARFIRREIAARASAFAGAPLTRETVS